MVLRLCVVFIVSIGVLIGALGVVAEDDLGKQIQSQLDSLIQTISSSADLNQVNEILDDTVNFPRIAQGVLGKHRGTLSPDQQKLFQQIFDLH